MDAPIIDLGIPFIDLGIHIVGLDALILPPAESHGVVGRHGQRGAGELPRLALLLASHAPQPSQPLAGWLGFHLDAQIIDLGIQFRDLGIHTVGLDALVLPPAESHGVMGHRGRWGAGEIPWLALLLASLAPTCLFGVGWWLGGYLQPAAFHEALPRGKQADGLAPLFRGQA